MLVTFFVFQVLIFPHSPSGQSPWIGSTARHAATAAWMLSSVSGFLAAAGVAEVVVDVDVDVGVAAAFLLFAEVVLAVGEAGVVGETCWLACCCAMFGAVFGAAPGAAGHPDGW